jgi:hypothetical protein
MNMKNHKRLSIKTLLSIAGVAGASVLMSFPVFAQTTPSRSDSPSETQQMTGERKPTDDRYMQNQTPGSQQINTGTSSTSDRQMNSGSTTVETQQYNRSTTSQQVSPTDTPAVSPTDTPAVPPTDTPAVSPSATPTTPQNNTSPTPSNTQETPDQGVRALW